MARTRKALPAKVDIAHLISTGVLASVCPRPLIEEVLQETARASQRERLLPAPAVVYYVMALALWREAPLEEVLRVVCEGLQWLGGGQADAVQASKSAISQARTRLGPEVMERLAQRVLRPLAGPDAPGAWYRGLRVMALDGSCMDVADERANAEFFGYPTATRGQSAFPQARVLGLVECGTHAIVAADIAPYARSSEKAMAAERLPGWLRTDMLVLADRGFYSFKLWSLACASGAALLWRVASNIKLPAQEVLSDGSYLSTVFDSEDGARRHGRTVRVVEYALADSASPIQDSYRLVTTLLDPEQATCPGSGGAVPRALGDRGRVRRVQDAPSRQQHRAAQQDARAGAAGTVGAAAGALRHPAAHGAGGLAARARPRSAELQQRRARDQAKDAASRGRSPLSVSTTWRDSLLAEIARGRCVSSRGRLNPRGVKRKMSNFQVRRRGAALHRKHQPMPVLRI